MCQTGPERHPNHQETKEKQPRHQRKTFKAPPRQTHPRGRKNAEEKTQTKENSSTILRKTKKLRPLAWAAKRTQRRPSKDPKNHGREKSSLELSPTMSDPKGVLMRTHSMDPSSVWLQANFWNHRCYDATATPNSTASREAPNSTKHDLQGAKKAERGCTKCTERYYIKSNYYTMHAQ